jgi:hypothetical protein
MKNQNHKANAFQHKRQGKDTQLRAVFNAFYEQPRTMKEVFVCTGVLREFVCWYCRELRLSGRLHFIKKRKCSITGEWVKEYTTNEKFIPEYPKQLKLF